MNKSKSISNHKNKEKEVKVKLIDKKNFERIVEMEEITHFIDYPLVFGGIIRFEFDGYENKIAIYKEITPIKNVGKNKGKNK